MSFAQNYTRILPMRYPTYQPPLTPRVHISNLPVEILLMIMEFLPVLDLVSLFPVCRLFKHLLSDDLFWRSQYRSASILRPPGPFSGQSTAFLRNALVSSARVAQNWPPHTLSPTPRVGKDFQIFHNFRTFHNFPFSKLLAGRWLIAGDSQLIWCYDLHNPIPRMFYRPHLMANFFQCVSTTDDKGELVVFAVSETQVGNSRRGINIYKVAMDHNGPVITSRILRQDVPDSYPGVSDVTIGPRFLVVVPKGPYFIQTLPIIVDITTFQRYDISLPASLLQRAPRASHISTFIPTTSYLLALHTFWTQPNGLHSLVLAWPLEPQSPGRPKTLQASHSTWVQDLGITSVTVLRDDRLWQQLQAILDDSQAYARRIRHYDA
ncbi:hypothetical protein PAXINDRAFT_103080 [Paxillus involutus ATCC 200175]|uniref:F-box domain-containing protein n=1 Tax=Paxillus involutus ATCC 200175 TaxID=664439 RepID=A0A0C9TIP0_PAXIN|nr:hypothetical protein PAXINDRAFT_103080 [Paxillus involutus ATCC 200175]